MRAYLLGLLIGPWLVLGAAYAVNESGPETCTVRSDITLNGHPVAVESCTGRLGLVVRDPKIIGRLD